MLSVGIPSRPSTYSSAQVRIYTVHLIQKDKTLTNGSNILHRSRRAEPSDLAAVPEKKLWELTAAMSLARSLSPHCAHDSLSDIRYPIPLSHMGGRTALVIMFNLFFRVSLVLSVELSKEFDSPSLIEYSVHKPREKPHNSSNNN